MPVGLVLVDYQAGPPFGLYSPRISQEPGASPLKVTWSFRIPTDRRSPLLQLPILPRLGKALFNLPDEQPSVTILDA